MRSEPNTCLDDDAIVDLLAGRVTDTQRLAALVHVDRCDACRRLVADAGAFGPDDPPPEPTALLGRGDAIGRYVVSRVLGMGAMGVVYAAHDPQLRRDVAIKLLRPEVAGEREAAASRTVMLREAQTLARLSHPNVIALHDADVHADQLFLVMELVDGETLREWLSRTDRAWPALRDVFVQAARGLAAAHAAGLVHRDFKPDNVLVGRDGRVRVTDFGLARWNATSSPALPRGGALRSSTQLAGTPAYMAPEQLAGLPVDARADVFAFSVTLFEAIYGVRPFDGRLLEGPAAAGAALPPIVAAPRRGVPGRVRRAIERGLAASPADRPRGMDPVVRELDRGPRRTGALVAAGLVLAAAAATAGAVAWRGDNADARCPESDAIAAWGPIWSQPQTAAVRDAFTATGEPNVADAFAETDRTMLAYRARWLALFTGACRASPSDAVRARRLECLETRRRRAEDFAGGLVKDTAENHWLVGEAASMARQLYPLEDCADARGDDIASAKIRPLRGAASGVSADGTLEIFAIGAGDRVWHVARHGPYDAAVWSAWSPIAEPLAMRSLLALRNRGGDLAVIGVDARGGIQNAGEDPRMRWDDAHWGRVRPTGSLAAGALDASGRVQLFAADGDAVWHAGQEQPGSAFSVWDRAPGGAAEQLVAVADPHAMHLFGVTDGRAWHAQLADGAWSARTELPSDAKLHALAAALAFDGTLELAALDEHGTPVRTRFAGAAEPWEPLGTTPVELASIALFVQRGAVHAIGATRTGRVVTLYQKRPAKGAPFEWNRWWEELPFDRVMGAARDAMVAQDADGVMYVIAANERGELWMLWSKQGVAHGWLLL